MPGLAPATTAPMLIPTRPSTIELRREQAVDGATEDRRAQPAQLGDRQCDAELAQLDVQPSGDDADERRGEPVDGVRREAGDRQAGDVPADDGRVAVVEQPVEHRELTLFGWRESPASRSFARRRASAPLQRVSAASPPWTPAVTTPAGRASRCWARRSPSWLLPAHRRVTTTPRRPRPDPATTASTATTDPAATGSIAENVDIGGGRTIYVECQGEGSPTVLLLSGGGTASDLWHAPDQDGPNVYDTIGAETRVCAYDRPGVQYLDGSPSRSTPVAQPITPQSGADDLQAILDALDMHGPLRPGRPLLRRQHRPGVRRRAPRRRQGHRLRRRLVPRAAGPDDAGGVEHLGRRQQPDAGADRRLPRLGAVRLRRQPRSGRGRRSAAPHAGRRADGQREVRRAVAGGHRRGPAASGRPPRLRRRDRPDQHRRPDRARRLLPRVRARHRHELWAQHHDRQRPGGHPGDRGRRRRRAGRPHHAHRWRRPHRPGAGRRRAKAVPGVQRHREPDGGPAVRLRERRRHLERHRHDVAGGVPRPRRDQPGVHLRPARVDDHHDERERYPDPGRDPPPGPQRFGTHAPGPRRRGHRAPRPAHRRRRAGALRARRALAGRRVRPPLRAHVPRRGRRAGVRRLPAPAGTGPRRRRAVGEGAGDEPRPEPGARLRARVLRRRHAVRRDRGGRYAAGHPGRRRPAGRGAA